MHRLVLDTNILLSAFLYGGKPGQLWDMVRGRDALLVTSPAMLSEFAVILRDKFRWSEEDVRDAVATVGYVAELMRPSRQLSVIPDEADNRVLEAALEGRADSIISGDHYLLALGEFRGVSVMSAAAYLATR